MTGPDEIARIQNAVQSHYEGFGDREKILSAVNQGNPENRPIGPNDLAPFDHLHTGGVAATRKLVGLLAPRAADHVLDVGCGLGGPARLLAALTGCRVTGIDLTPGFVETAQAFCALTGLAERVDICQGSALDLPFPDAHFDAAWHIHMSMNVPDKPRMYREIGRVLRPGARLALHDPVAGPARTTYPVPWADSAASSFLLRADELVDVIAAAGFDLEVREDATTESLGWFADAEAARSKMSPDEAARMTAHLRPGYARTSRNHRDNLAAGAIQILRTAFRRRA